MGALAGGLDCKVVDDEVCAKAETALNAVRLKIESCLNMGNILVPEIRPCAIAMAAGCSELPCGWLGWRL
jgi:hypothetical protein